ncbi:crustapain-like [Diabrotica virgifera virgifera]|uniref:Crustapain-like n=1 Tax=Diabrotica virgifera virgifera TaxID=50390 RepID=A0A6P7FMB3_DIAVI|nr:crustapain-like [Diabrotica virgifera virgifera]
MFKNLFFLGLVAVAIAHFTYLSDDEEFENFKIKFNKNYSSDLEEKLRKQIFINSLNRVKEQNEKYEKGEDTWYAGINQFSDMTDEEKRRHTGLLPPPIIKFK